MTRHGYLSLAAVVAATWGVVGLVGCSSDKSPSAGCATDMDCKGDRVCNEGQCVDPSSSGGAGDGSSASNTADDTTTADPASNSGGNTSSAASSSTGGSGGVTGSGASGGTNADSTAGAGGTSPGEGGEGGFAAAPSGPPAQEVCDSYCQVDDLEGFCFAPGCRDCTDRLASTPEPCDGALANLYQCVFDLQESCPGGDIPSECSDARDALDNCEEAHGPYGCGSPITSMSQSATRGDGGAPLPSCSVASDCDGMPRRIVCDTADTCECFVGGEELGSWASLGACDNGEPAHCRGVLDGCCREVFGL